MSDRDALVEILRELLYDALVGDVDAIEDMSKDLDGDLAALAKALKDCAIEISKSRITNPQYLAALARKHGVILYNRSDYKVKSLLTRDTERAVEVALVYEALFEKKRRLALQTFKLWKRAIHSRK